MEYIEWSIRINPDPPIGPKYTYSVDPGTPLVESIVHQSKAR